MPFNLSFSVEKTRQWALLSVAFLNALAMLTLNAQAQTADSNFPTQSIKILVGFAPGGSSDTVARIMVPKLTELFKQTVVIDNKPGAGGNIATDLLTKASPDGHTIMLGTVGSLSVNQHLNKLNYDPVVDTAALSLCVVFSNVLVVNSASDVKTFAQQPTDSLNGELMEQIFAPIDEVQFNLEIRDRAASGPNATE